MSRKLRPLAGLALIAVVGAGCSNASAETGTGGSDTTRSKAVAFAGCMRDHGIEDFPDPDSSGTLTIDDVANGSSVDTSSPAFDHAIEACKDLQPPGFTGRRRSASQQKAALLFAQCIREHGVKDFPDPDADGPLIDTRRIPSTRQKGGMDILNAAMRTCGRHHSRDLGLQP